MSRDPFLIGVSWVSGGASKLFLVYICFIMSPLYW